MLIVMICKKTADEFYSKYEHLGNSGLGVWHYGLYLNQELTSVVSFGTTCFDHNRGSIGSIAAKYDIRVIQLARGGTKFYAPKNIPSQLISRALLKLRKEIGNCLVIAYSDTSWNEIGTIYQACNFIYLGLTNPGGQSNYYINGKHMSGWLVRKNYGTRNIEKLKNMGLDVVRKPLIPKHRYLYVNTPPLMKEFIMKELLDQSHQYPKRNELSVGSMNEIRQQLNMFGY